MIIDILNEIWNMFFEMAPYMMLGLVFVGILHLFLSKDFLLKHMGDNSFSSISKASIFGIPLPLCSCSVIPTTVYMAENGASKSSTVSFLTSTPQTGVDSIIATYGMMGPVFAIFRPIAAFFMGIINGVVASFVEKPKPKKKMIELNQFQAKPIEKEVNLSAKEKAQKFYDYAFVDFLDGFSIHFIIGVIISGFISYFLPDEFLAEYGVNSGLLGMLLVVAVGVPMYICATASIPIAVTLMMKGLSPGVAFVFLAVGPATNAASLTILFESLGKKTTIVYLLMMILTSMLFGYILDVIFNIFDFNIMNMLPHEHEKYLIHPIADNIIVFLFLGLLIMSLLRKYTNIFGNSNDEVDLSKAEQINIQGMTCENCVASVNKAIRSVDGVNKVKIDLSKDIAYIEGDYNSERIIEKITKAGYKVVN